MTLGDKDTNFGSMFRYESTWGTDIPPALFPPVILEGEIGDGRAGLYLRTFNIIRVTPKGVWIALEYNYKGEVAKKKFILANSRKKYACFTLEEARVSFLIRKQRQLAILKHQMEITVFSIEAILKEM